MLPSILFSVDLTASESSFCINLLNFAGLELINLRIGSRWQFLKSLRVVALYWFKKTKFPV